MIGNFKMISDSLCWSLRTIIYSFSKWIFYYLAMLFSIFFLEHVFHFNVLKTFLITASIYPVEFMVAYIKPYLNYDIIFSFYNNITLNNIIILCCLIIFMYCIVSVYKIAFMMFDDGLVKTIENKKRVMFLVVTQMILFCVQYMILSVLLISIYYLFVLLKSSEDVLFWFVLYQFIFAPIILYFISSYLYCIWLKLFDNQFYILLQLSTYKNAFSILWRFSLVLFLNAFLLMAILGCLLSLIFFGFSASQKLNFVTLLFLDFNQKISGMFLVCVAPIIIFYMICCIFMQVYLFRIFEGKIPASIK